MKTLVEMIVPHIASWLAGIAAILFAWAKIRAASKPRLKTAPANAKPRAASETDEPAAPAEIAASAPRSRFRRVAFWGAVADLLITLTTLGALLVLVRDPAPATVGDVATVGLCVAFLVTANLRKW